MSLPLLFSVIIFTPLVAGVVIAILGRVGRLQSSLAVGVAVLGAVIPLLTFGLLASSWLSPFPLGTALFGQTGARDWWAPALQLDDFAALGALGVMLVVAPFLLWLAWRGGFTHADQAADGSATATAPVESEPLAGERWQGISLTLALETAALAVCFGNGVGWVAFWWLVLAACVWLLGELGSAPSALDRVSGVALAIGPILWFATMFLVGNAEGSFRLSEMFGVGKANVLTTLLPQLAVAFAAGLYPFLGWVRRRALLTPPAGLAALLMLALPVALFVGGRTFTSVQNTAGLMANIGALTPPVTAGILWVVLGALTIAICGLVSLGTRSPRILLANLAATQAGWGLLALGINLPGAIYGYVSLLGAMILGLGAMIASQVVGGTLKPDYELDGAGPRPFGLSPQPINLVIWTVGALSLIGAPLFAGFDPRHLISSGSLKASQLVIPLVGFAWAGDLLLVIALLRCIAPAFTEWSIEARERMRNGGWLRLTAEDIPGALLAVLAVIAGIVPPGALWLNGHNPAAALLQTNIVQTAPSVGPFGYATQVSQWLPGFMWIAVLILGGIVAAGVAKPRTEVAPAMIAVDDSAQDSEAPVELLTLNEPEVAWSDLARSFTSGVTIPGWSWLDPNAAAEEPADEEAEAETTTDEAKSATPREQQTTGGQA